MRLAIIIFVDLFYKDEIKRALFQMEKINLIHLTIFVLNSIKVVGGIIRKDIIEVFEEFHSEKINVSKINYDIISLLPKVKEASKIQQYRPIFLLIVYTNGLL